MAIESYQPQLPLDLDENSKFNMISQSLANAKQKLKMIILTSPGEKIMDPAFGVGIYKYLFEPNLGIITVENNKITLENLQASLYRSISTQVYKYSPDITIQNINISIDDIVLNITIEYTYRNFAADTLVISLST